MTPRSRTRADGRARITLCRLGTCLLGLLVIQACQKPQGESLPEPVDSSPRLGPASPLQGALPPEHPPIALPGAPGEPSAPATNRPLPAGTRNPMEDIMAFRARVEKDPKDVEALIALGNANMVISRFDAAQDLYRRVLDITPKNLDVRTNLAIAYQYGGKSNEAFAELQKNLAIDPKHGNSLYNIAFLYLYDKQDKAKAVETWKTWLALNPTDPAAAEVSKQIADLEAGRTPPTGPPPGAGS
jgi:cytochrome c-type biogenesis protein CcmH/NrfG